MNPDQKEKIIKTILEREKLRPLSRLQRLIKAPLRTLPFYVIASLTRITPFKLTFKTLWDDPMTCYMPEGNTFLYYGSCEANLTNFLIKNLKPGQTVIDIGAHVGFYSMLSSRLVEKMTEKDESSRHDDRSQDEQVRSSYNGQVHSFEPTPWTFSLLKKNTKSRANIFVNNFAVSDSKSIIQFFDYGPGFGAFNTSDQKGAPALNKQKTLVEVQTVSIDEYCHEHTLKPDFIKLDAEGAEHLILKGMTETMKNARPMISLEVAGDEQWKENREKCFEILKQHRYKPYDIHVDGTLEPHTPRAEYTYDNLIFLADSRAAVLH